MNTTVLLAPRSPLVFRPGTRFDASGGEAMASLPPPGTIAGAIRAAVADALDLPLERDADHASLLERIAVQGPLLVQGRGSDSQVYLPRPADAVYLQSGDPQTPRLLPATPRRLPENAGACDIPTGLMPVFVDGEAQAKRVSGPACWSLLAMVAWLMNGAGPGGRSVTALPPVDRRSHVAIDPRTLAHDEGRLFRTAGLDFGARRQRGTGFDNAAWGLLTRISDTEGTDLTPALHGAVRRVGADGRGARLLADAGAWPALDPMLAAALSQLKAGDCFRIALATPAIFADAWRPGWLDTGIPPGTRNVRVELVAAAINGWSAYSGWDMREKRPRAIRRLAPAGSVYWFKLCEGRGEDLLPLWLAPVSDRAQDRADGFGLALPGLANIERSV